MTITMHYRRLWLGLGIAYIGIILAGSLLKVPEVNVQLGNTDKIIHFTMYFILVFWFIQLYVKRKSRLIILLSAILLGFFIEYLQGLTPYRSFDYEDEIANAIGAVCAFLFSNTPFNTLLGRVDLLIYEKINT